MNPLPWHEVEYSILKEEAWLQEVFDFGPYSEADQSTPIPPGLSNDKMIRQIAISIVRGVIEAREIQSNKEFSLWSDMQIDMSLDIQNEERHGGYWHQRMMGVVKKHFTNTGFEVVNEPTLSLGRADLGVYKDGYKNLFVEIGTTSLFKTWFNIQTMSETIFLFIPTTTRAIELQVNKMPHYANQ
jgi:hypothetical protein